MDARERSTLRRETLRAAGLCIQCGKNPPVHPVQKCQVCRDQFTARRNKKKLEQPHLCINCKRVKEPTDKLTCTTCKTRAREHKIAKRKKDKLCSRCVARKPLPGKLVCETCRVTHKKIRVTLKDATYQKYGGYICKWCGITDPLVLNVDHINNDGYLHRRHSGFNVYGWVKKNNYPPGFQILCRNCNWAKSKGRTGPTVDQIPPRPAPDDSFPPYEVPFYLRG